MKKVQLISTQTLVPSIVPAVQSINRRAREEEEKEEPVVPGDVHYALSHKKHRERVSRIRQCVNAAVVIQRAWRQYSKN